MGEKKRIILGVTGSIAAYKSADLTRGLIEKGLRVSVVLTKKAEHFITPLTLASLSGEKVFRGMIDQENDSWQMPHIELAKNADLLLIAPATANVIAKIAHGLADDLLTCVTLATKAPVLLAPAMNTEMFHNSIVEDNCERLQKNGMTFIKPVEGKLACGVFGDGHIAEEETIINSVLEHLK